MRVFVGFSVQIELSFPIWDRVVKERVAARLRADGGLLLEEGRLGEAFVVDPVLTKIGFSV